jgi:hypothetical protein
MRRKCIELLNDLSLAGYVLKLLPDAGDKPLREERQPEEQYIIIAGLGLL